MTSPTRAHARRPVPSCPGALVLQSTSRALPEHHNPYKRDGRALGPASARGLPGHPDRCALALAQPHGCTKTARLRSLASSRRALLSTVAACCAAWRFSTRPRACVRGVRVPGLPAGACEVAMIGQRRAKGPRDFVSIVAPFRSGAAPLVDIPLTRLRIALRGGAFRGRAEVGVLFAGSESGGLSDG
jgi:hypothetical protein